MRKLASTSGLAGLGVALLLGVATTGAAQTDTTRLPVTKAQPKQTSGIPVRKSALPDTAKVTTASPGEVVTPRDTTPPKVEQPAAVTPAPEPIAVPPMEPRKPFLFGTSGMYLGLAGGVAVPTGTFSDIGYHEGAHVSVPLGWQPQGQVLGVRGLFAFDQGRAKGINPSRSSAKVYSAALDLTAKFPLLVGESGYGLSFYALGGGGAYRFTGFGGVAPLADALGTSTGDKNVTKFGIDAGGGFEWGLGSAAIFVESRLVHVYTTGTRTQSGNNGLNWVPIVLGVNLR